jgi:uncharacterized protein YhaN
MIGSEAQKELTVAQIAALRKALAKLEPESPGKRTAAVRGSYEGMLRQLEDELRKYERLKSGELSWANSAVERIRARARNLKAGALDWDACKADRDAGRP